MAFIDRSHPELIDLKGKVWTKDYDFDFVKVETYRGDIPGQALVKFWSGDRLPQFIRCFIDWKTSCYFQRAVKQVLKGKRLMMHYHNAIHRCLWAQKTDLGVEFSQFDMFGNKDYSFEVAVEDIRRLFLAIEHFSGRETV